MKEDQFPRMHLGDGCYASFDGYQIWLQVNRYGAIERVALEPQVFENLLNYAVVVGFKVEKPTE